MAETKFLCFGYGYFPAFINSVMQEVLVRGYLYQMIKNNYNIVVAVLISTGLFNIWHMDGLLRQEYFLY